MRNFKLFAIYSAELYVRPLISLPYILWNIPSDVEVFLSRGLQLNDLTIEGPLSRKRCLKSNKHSSKFWLRYDFSSIINHSDRNHLECWKPKGLRPCQMHHSNSPTLIKMAGTHVSERWKQKLPSLKVRFITSSFKYPEAGLELTLNEIK